MMLVLASVWSILPDWLQRQLIFHLNAKYNLGTNVIIFNEQGQVWLQKHRFWSHYPWGLPGGHVNRREAPHQAAIREIKEELGADLAIMQLLDIQLSDTNQRTTIAYYLGQFTSPLGQLDQNEILEAAYFDLDQLPIDTLPAHRQIIQHYYQLLQEDPKS